MYRMLSIAEAQETVLKAVSTLGSQKLKITDAVGQILAQDVRAQEPLPPFPASIKVAELADLQYNNHHRVELEGITKRLC
jgi:hypothetical protein